jgi:glyoxylase-like metal-dependent hydrolase (beta-lactamase superfamily II)
MRRLTLALGIGALLLGASLWQIRDGALAQGRIPAGTGHQGDAFRFNKVAEGVYHAVGTGALTVVGNGAVIVNDDDVVIVDDHVSPAAGWVLLEEVKRLTPKPVRYVINTHFHYDHSSGNQVFGRGVDIIGHEFTREMLASGKPLQMPLYKSYVDGLPNQIASLRDRVAKEPDAAAKARLQTQLTSAENNLASQKELTLVPPNMTLTTQMTLFRGSREIQLRFLGRGHTAGDVVVYLPKEKIAITGDFLTAGMSNLSDSFPEEWAASLDALKKLDFTTVLPGHGEAYTDKAKIDYYQAYLRDAWAQASKLKQQGVSAEEASKRIDMSAHKAHYPPNANLGVNLAGVQRMYELLDRGGRP